MKKNYLPKLLMLCMTLSLTASLSACGRKAPAASVPVESETAAEAVTEEPKDSSEKEAPEETSAEDTTAEEASTEAPAETTAETEEDIAPEELFGTLTDSSYENNYFGFRYDLPENWYFLSGEELSSVTDLGKAAVGDESLSSAFEKAGSVINCYATDTVPAIEGSGAYNNVNVAIQDIGKFYGILLDEKEIAEASINTTIKALSSMGLNDVTTEISEMEFLGKSCTATTITSSAGDVKLYQKQIFLKKGAVLACITPTTFGEDKTDEVLSAFHGSNEESTTAETSKSDTDMASLPLSSGTISIDGDLFVMGESFTKVPDAWHLKPEDAEKYKVYSLNPRTTSGTAMGVYKEKYGYDYSSFHVMLSLMNISESPIPYLEGDIDYLSISSILHTEVVPPVILPGGLTLESTEEDFIAAYGEPDHVYEDASTEYKSLSFKDGDVDLDVTWSKGKINEITLGI